MGGSRRKFIKASIGVGILVLSYLAWRQYNLPIPEETEQNKPPPSGGGGGGGGNGEQPPEQEPQEINIEFTEYPRSSPVEHSSPYLMLEPLSANQDGGVVYLDLNCHNRGGAPSTAVLEVFRIDGDKLTFPLILSDLPRVYNTIVHLSPGTAIPVSLSLPVLENTLGYIFVLSDPLLDSCPRVFNSSSDLENYLRKIIYFGK